MTLELDHIRPEFRHIIGLSDRERIAFLDQPRWVGHRAAISILQTLDGLLIKPRRPRMPNLLLVGESNNGKTTIVEEFVRTSGKPYVNEYSEPVKPIILAQAPPTADEKGLYISILERFFTPYRATDTTARLRYQVIHLFRACHSRMLIIDEIHSLMTGTRIKQREIMNAIKLICNELAIPVVGVGTQDALAVIETDPQHASRFDVLNLPLWRLDKEFQELLNAFEQMLPLKKRSNLHARDLATVLHTLSAGNIGDLSNLLMACSIDAITSGKELIDKDLIDKRRWTSRTTARSKAVYRELFT